MSESRAMQIEIEIESQHTKKVASEQQTNKHTQQSLETVATRSASPRREKEKKQ